MTTVQLEALLRASLELWQVEAVLKLIPHDDRPPAHGPSAPLRAWLSLPDGRSLGVAEAAPDDEPFRWWLLWQAPGAALDAPAARRKPCASTLGLLRSLREALGVPAVAKVRVGTGAGIGGDIDAASGAGALP